MHQGGPTCLWKVRWMGRTREPARGSGPGDWLLPVRLAGALALVDLRSRWPSDYLRGVPLLNAGLPNIHRSYRVNT